MYTDILVKKQRGSQKSKVVEKQIKFESV